MGQKKWALITGATAGIGWATAEKLANSGYNLFLIGRREARLSELKNQLTSSSAEVITHVLDVRIKKQVEGFVEKYSEKLPHLDVLVNNAGLAKSADKVFEANTDDWDIMIDTNIKGLLYFTRAIIPYFMKKNSGHIVNIGSVSGRWVYPNGVVYCSTKFAVRAISEGLRMDLLGKNIRVTNIEPGMVNTEFSKVRYGSQEKADQVYTGMQPLVAKDIADTIFWCLDRPAHVNIQELVIYPTDQASVSLVHRSST